jgi:hypothetical protein
MSEVEFREVKEEIGVGKEKTASSILGWSRGFKAKLRESKRKPDF